MNIEAGNSKSCDLCDIIEHDNINVRPIHSENLKLAYCLTREALLVGLTCMIVLNPEGYIFHL